MGENIKVIRKVIEIEFWHDYNYYSYKVMYDENEYVEYIFKSDELIFQSNKNNSNEGELIYAIFKAEVNP